MKRMSKNRRIRVLVVLIMILGIPAGKSAAQVIDPDDLKPAEKAGGKGAGIHSAPLNWVTVDSAFGPLPGSVHVFRTTDSLAGRPEIAYYVSAPLKDKSLLFTAQVGYGKRWKPSEYYEQEQNPLLVINTSF